MAWRKPANLRDWVGILARHRKKFFFPAVVGAMAIMVGSFWIPRQYRAEGKFEKRYDVAAQESNSIGTIARVAPGRLELQEQLKGYNAIDRLVDDLDLAKGEGFRRTADGYLDPEGQMRKRDLVTRIRASLQVYFQSQGADLRDHIVVTYTDKEPALAARIVQRAMENYIRRSEEQVTEALAHTREYMDKQKRDAQAKANDLEERKNKFEADYPDLNPTDPAGVRTKKATLEADLTRASDDLKMNEQMMAAFKAELQRTPAELEVKQTESNPEAIEAQKQIQALEFQIRNAIGAGMTEEHPTVKKLRVQLELAKRDLARIAPDVEKVQKVPNEAIFRILERISECEGKVKALKSREEELRTQVERYSTYERNLRVLSAEFKRLTKELEEANQQVIFWDGRLKTILLAVQNNAAQKALRMSIIQTPDEYARPSSPTLFGILAVAALVAVAAGAVMAFLAEILDHSFHSVEQAVDGLKVPVLGAVNEIITPAAAFRRRILGLFVYPAMGATMLLVLLTVLFVVYLNLEHKTKYDNLRTDPVGFLKTSLFK